MGEVFIGDVGIVELFGAARGLAGGGIFGNEELTGAGVGWVGDVPVDGGVAGLETEDLTEEAVEVPMTFS